MGTKFGSQLENFLYFYFPFVGNINGCINGKDTRSKTGVLWGLGVMGLDLNKRKTVFLKDIVKNFTVR